MKKAIFVMGILTSTSALAELRCNTVPEQNVRICGSVVYETAQAIAIDWPLIDGSVGGPLKPTDELENAVCLAFGGTHSASITKKVKTGRIYLNIEGFKDFWPSAKRKVLRQVICKKS